MIEFRHLDSTIHLAAGDSYAAPVGPTYQDAPAEELRLLAAEVKSGVPWRDAVLRRYGTGYPWLARIVTDPARDLFFREHPPIPGARVLDLGAGWGQISLPLARHHEVTALEPTPERLNFIRAAAGQERVSGRLHFVQADFFEVEFATKFDLVACIGVLEWVARFRAGPPRELQIEFLERIRRLLAPQGRVVIGIENRFGLKYLLGSNDDHLALPNIAVLDQALATQRYLELTGQPLRSFTYTQAEYRELLHQAGFQHVGFFAALPDYKVPQRIIPLDSPAQFDAFLLLGNFVPEHDGANGRPLPNQDELRSHYHSLAQLGVAHLFAPSYFVVAR